MVTRGVRGWVVMAAFELLASACTLPRQKPPPAGAAGTMVDPARATAVAGVASPPPMGAAAPPALAADGGSPAAAAAPAPAAAGPGGDMGAMSPPAAGEPVPPAGAVPGGPSTERPSGELRGRVIDEYLQPLAGVRVFVASSIAITSESGEFRLGAVGATYDATLIAATPSADGGTTRHVWRYEGLTRRDPTLQIEAAAAAHSASITLEIEGVDFATRPDGDVVLTSFGSASGSWNTAQDISGPTLRDTLTWRGPSSVQFKVHALRMLKLDGRIEASDFYSYDFAAFDLDQDAEVSASIELPNTSYVNGGSITGEIADAAGVASRVRAYLRFADHAAIEFVDDPGVTGVFNYFIPKAAESSVTLMASRAVDDTLQVAHADGLHAGSGHIVLRLPEAPMLMEPRDGQTAEADTAFQWSGKAGLYLFRASAASGELNLQVVTANPLVRLPIASGIDLGAGRSYTWWVETHGGHMGVDQAAGEKGFLDTCVSREPRGPERGTGTYSESAGRQFVTPGE